MRIAITGIGVVTSNAGSRDMFKKALFQGIDGVGDVKRFDTDKLKIKRGYEISCPLPSTAVASTRLLQCAYAAAEEAIQDSAIERYNDQTCLLTGSGLGDEEFVISLAKNTQPDSEKKHIHHRLGPQLAELTGIKGGVISNGTACCASLFSVAHGFDLIKNNECDVVIAGGAETFSVNSMGYFSRVTNGHPDMVQPFDRHRKGMLLGEGAGFIVLESVQRALENKKKCYGEIRGYGLSCDAFHLSNMDLEGVQTSISRALQNAGLKPLDIDYIAAHGTGTSVNDITETKAIKNVYEEYAFSTPVSSIKSMIGHTGGASGVIGLISGLLAIENQKLPPTINYRHPDHECDLDYVPNIARDSHIQNVQVNSFGFGGANCSLIISAVTDR